MGRKKNKKRQILVFFTQCWKKNANKLKIKCFSGEKVGRHSSDAVNRLFLAKGGSAHTEQGCGLELVALRLLKGLLNQGLFNGADDVFKD